MNLFTYVARIAVRLAKDIVEALRVDRLDIGAEAREVGADGRFGHQVLEEALAAGAERAAARRGIRIYISTGID